MLFLDLKLVDVRRILIAWWAGRPAARCFAGYQGSFVKHNPGMDTRARCGRRRGR
jgi:hypothetical protein